MNATVASSSPDTYHPAFNSEGDVVLVTSDSIRFRITSPVLRTASGFFRTMFDSAHPDPGTPLGEPSVISVDEDAHTMTVLLKVASGMRVDFFKTLPNIEDMERVMFAGEKYDMPAVMEAMELMMYTPTAKSRPLHRYALASRYGWSDICADAAIDTLDLEIDFHDVPAMDLEHFNRLLRLRSRRVAAMSAALNDKNGRFKGGNRGTCAPDGTHTLAQPTAWEVMKRYILYEMTIRPSGSSIDFADPCCVAVATAVCPKCPAATRPYLFAWEVTRRNIERILASLPKDLV
ncbi:hypothetical protein EXIGLDRAFT_725708 [Exidia glandulosa HHB12029]|uniref:BTB domain-containing protein n=1 Tax=Exidia glandulosa HHB12029 TaxID=1314781 RepID=A0A165Q8S9_EXIGL|nr:hypothetical protein EXIGLDRAFT_725708 [Exidia glandulosa HHB12029]